MSESVSPTPMALATKDPGARIDPVLIREIFETLANTQPLRAKLEAIAASVCSRLGVDFVGILLEGPGSDRLLIEGSAGLSPSYVTSVNARHRIHGGAPAGIRVEALRFDQRLTHAASASSEAFLTGLPVIVPDTQTDRHAVGWRSLFEQQGIRSFISLPLPCRGAVIGTLNCYHQTPRSYTEDEVQTLGMVATQVGIAVEIARLVETQQQTIGRLEELTQQLNEQRDLLERTARIQTTLTQLVLNNQGIAAIAGALARVVHCPVVVQDQFYQVLATGEVPDATSGDEDAAAVPDERGAIPRIALAVYSSQPGERNPRAAFELQAMPKRGLNHPRAVAPILAGRQLLGYVSLVLGSLPTPALTMRALAQAATVLALEMVKDRLAHEVELRQRRGFADDLLAGRYDDPQQMRDRGRYLGHDLRGPFQVLVFDIDQFGHYVAQQGLSDTEIDVLRRRFLDAILSVARTYSPHALVAGRHDQLALILSAVGEQGSQSPRAGQRTIEHIVAAAQHACQQNLPDLTVSIGIGKVYDELTTVTNSYTEARRALHVVRRLGARGKTMTYADLGVARLLFQVENPAELREFALTRMGPVLAYDRRHDGVLLAALEAYFACNQSVQEAAQQLDLHPNTLRYRLRKVEELLSMSLTTVSLLLDLQLACLILRLLDATDPPPAARPARSRVSTDVSIDVSVEKHKG